MTRGRAYEPTPLERAIELGLENVALAEKENRSTVMAIRHLRYLARVLDRVEMSPSARDAVAVYLAAIRADLGCQWEMDCRDMADGIDANQCLQAYAAERAAREAALLNT
jgi:hypothetical protein